MKTNVGNLDRIIRIVLGLAVIGLGVYFQSWWGGLGLIFVVTGLVRFCPIWMACRINTTGQKA
jgi:Protein of unknown function (DUF2892)